jgi:hypothetical protein
VLDLFAFFVVAIYMFQLLESIGEAVRWALLQYYVYGVSASFHPYVAAGMRGDELGVGSRLWW